MWTGGRSIEQFKCFGDTVTFDTTYKTNLYDILFGLFVSVNNHFQSIIFGSVLMSNKKVDTFKWIFTEFFQMIGAPQPRTILTGTENLRLEFFISALTLVGPQHILTCAFFLRKIDQARAMEVAIADVMPSTTHCWCKWHVLKQPKECLGPLLAKGSEFKPEFNKLIHHMVTEQEFEDGWACIIDKHGIQEKLILD